MRGYNSKLIHGNIEKEKSDVYGALRTAIYDSAAFEFGSSEEIADAFQGKITAHSYSRITNPTISELEERINFTAGGEDTLCLSSGMAAISNTILALCSSGDNIITTKNIFGNTYSLFENILKPLGIEPRFIDMENSDEIEKNIDKNTKVIFLENITNPHLIIFDIKKIGEIAKKHNIILAVDNTIPTNYLFDCRRYGIDIEIMSTTKAMSGGGTSVGGAIIIHKSEKWEKSERLKSYYEKFGDKALIKKLRKEIYRNFGSCLSPHSAYYQILGMETMALRIEKSCSNALKLAEVINTNDKIKNVNYPGIKNNKYNYLIERDFGGRGGTILTFELETMEKCFEFMNNLKMIRRATNVCDNKTLVIHPYSTIFCEYSDEQKRDMGISKNMIRLSVGIEDVEDIIEDIYNSI